MKQFIVRTLPCAVAGLALALAPMAQAAVSSIDSVTGRVLIKRGEAYLPVDPSVVLEVTDSLVLVNGASVTVSCGGVPLQTFYEPGVYSVPECPAAVADTDTNGSVDADADTAGGATGGSTASTTGAEPVPSKYAQGVMATGAIGLAAVVVASAQGGADDEKPASP